MRRSRPPFQPLPLRASAEKGYPPITDESTPHSDTAGSPPPNADAPSAAATLSLEGGLAIAQSAALRGAAALGAVGSFGAETTVQPGQPPAQQQPVGPPPLAGTSRIQSDYTNLLSLAISLEKMARDEIDRLCGERPNDPRTIENNNKQRDLLLILADGFSRLAAALMEYSERPQPLLAGKAKEIADDIGAQFEVWWKKNAGEAIDWAFRIPTLVASIAALGWTGANMTFGTVAVSALVGGPKVITAMKAARKRHVT
jgi:hypothetical protein